MFMNPENVKQDFSMNEAIRRICMNSCTWAAVHLHHDQDQDRLQHSLQKYERGKDPANAHHNGKTKY